MKEMIAVFHEGNGGKAEADWGLKALDNWLLRTLVKRLDLDSSQVEYYPMGSKSNFFDSDF